jgi:ATP synthase F1 delta subunit
MNGRKSSVIVAKKYAHALLGFYNDVTYDEVQALESLGSKLTHSPRAMFVITMGLKHAHDTALLDRMSTELMVSAPVKKLLELLALRDRIQLFPLVCKWIGIYFRQAHGIMHFNVTSAVALQDTDKAVILNFLKQKTQATLEMEYRIDTTLIAGIRIQSGEYLWEKSIARLLRDIKLHNVQ